MEKQDIDALVRSARQALGEQRFEDAREIYRSILQSDPAQPRAWLALSALAQRDGRFREALLSARSSADAWKKSSTHAFIAEVCMRLLVLGDYWQVRELITGANRSDPNVLRYSMGLVQYLGLVDAHQDALQLADFALSKLRDAPAALLFARATALRHLGRMQEATQAYERCLAIDPLHAEAHWALAHHERSEVSGSRLPRLRKAISHVAPDTEDAIYLHYALFKELDDAGEIEDAWKALQRASQLKRRTVRHDADADDRLYDALIARCNRSFITDAAASEETSHHAPIFVVGLPRSGTTMLERMIGNHPRIRSAGELNDFPTQLCWETDRFLPDPLTPQSLSDIEGIDYSSLGRGYLLRTAWRAGRAPHLVDKLPNNLLNAGFIHKALPQARIICVQRNQMDSCFSTFKHLFSGQSYAYSYELDEMKRQYQRFDRLVTHWNDTLPDRWMHVHYEELVRDPINWAHRIAEFCGVDYDSAMVRIEDNASPSSTASSSQIREGVHARNVGSWERYAPWIESALR